MPKNVIKTVETSSLPNFPILEAYKHNRIITKHFTNLSMYMSHERFSFLSWLIYESNSDNTIVYNTNLFIKYRASVLAANNEYNNSYGTKLVNGLRTTVSNLRYSLKWLIENGYLFRIGRFKFIINPRLVYYEYLSPKEIAAFNIRYQSADKNNAIELMNDYIQMVKNKM